MKKIISTFVAASMFVLLCACSGTPAADTPSPAEPNTVQDTVPPVQPEAETPEAEQTAEPMAEQALPDLPDEQLIAVYLVQQFCSSDFFAEISRNYENDLGKAPREPELSHATVYQLGNMEGAAVHVLMIRLNADWNYNGGNDDNIFLLIDLETGDIYDSLTAGGTFGLVLNCMYSHTEFDNDIIYSEMETYTDFTEEEIAAVNSVLASGQIVNINVAEMTAAKNNKIRAEALAAAREAVKDFLGSEAFLSATEAYAEITQTENPVSVGNAVMYDINKFFGRNVHCVLVRIDAGIAVRDILSDNTVLLVYPDSGEVYDTLTTDMDAWSSGFSGMCESDEDIHNLLMNTYINYAVFGSDIIAAPDTEVITPFTDAELAEWNDSILP